MAEEPFSAEVEIVCTEARTIRPVRVTVDGVVREIVEETADRAGADAWEGMVRTADGLRLELAFRRAWGGWRCRRVADGDAPASEQEAAEDDDPAEALRRAALRRALRRD